MNTINVTTESAIMTPATGFIITGTLLYGAAVAATAQTAGPTWEIIGMGAVGLLVSWIGVYAKSISNRVTESEKSIKEMRELVLRDYHSKHELNDILSEIKASIRALHERFDRAGIGGKHG